MMSIRSATSLFVTVGCIALLAGCRPSDSTAPVSVPEVPSTGNPPVTANPPLSGNVTRAFLWSDEKGTQVIPVPDYIASVYPSEINDAGQVVGFVTLRRDQNQTHAFVWSAESGFTDLQLLIAADGNSLAGGVDASGTVTGVSEGPLSPTNGPMGPAYDYVFTWNAQSGMKLLGRYLDIVKQGSAGNNGADGRSTWFWTVARGAQRLPFPTGTTCADIHDISDNGRILGRAGSAKDCFEYYSPFMWETDGTQIMIENCFLVRFCQTSVSRINDSGQVTGSRNGTAFKWSRDGGFEQISMKGSSGRAINNNGDIAGDVFEVVHKTSTPFVWMSSGEITTIRLPAGARSGFAVAINGKAQVLGNFE